MMSLETIEEEARLAGEEAEVEGKEPYFLANEESKQDFPPFPFPNLGSYCPEGWEEVDRLFVDKLGSVEQTPEMFLHGCASIRQLIDWLDVGYGYAIVEEGEFQLYVGKFSYDE